mmetsp:Transcript_14263/g.23761  ORF Transcript_14263/g.23761 Transcript_14263/m.23761 type:complete len:82 (+) Transcript_14263:259-504(+)
MQASTKTLKADRILMRHAHVAAWLIALIDALGELLHGSIKLNRSIWFQSINSAHHPPQEHRGQTHEVSLNECWRRAAAVSV